MKEARSEQADCSSNSTRSQNAWVLGCTSRILQFCITSPRRIAEGHRYRSYSELLASSSCSLSHSALPALNLTLPPSTETENCTLSQPSVCPSFAAFYS